MRKDKLKLFPAAQVAVDMLGAGFSLDDKTLLALEAASNSPTVPRNEPNRKEVAFSNPIDDLVFGAILSGKLPCIDSKGIPLPNPPKPSQAKNWFVDPSDVNTLLINAGYRYMWSPKVKRAQRKSPVAQVSWKLRVQQEATAQCLRAYTVGADPSLTDLAKSLAAWCVKNNVVAEREKPPSVGYIRMHVLGSQHCVDFPKLETR